MSTARTVRTVITGLGTAVRGLQGPEGLLGPLPEGHGAAADPVSRLTGRGLRYKDRATKLAMAAAQDALRAAGLVDAAGDPTVPGRSTGVVASTNYGNADTVCDTVQTIAESTYLGTSPMLLPATSSNVVASWVAITHGLRGANLTLCNGPTSGLDAVNWARLLIASGRIQRALVVGVEPDNAAVRHITEAESRAPFDGAAALVVESAGSAVARGVRPFAEIGPYARRAGHAAAVAAVHKDRPGKPGLWCVPEHPDGIAAPAPSLGVVPTDAAVHDLSALYGPASGALGVLQCVAATVWLAGRAEAAGTESAGAPAAGVEAAREDMALLTAGTGDAGGDDASAAMILTAPAVREAASAGSVR
ncbi:beta-ketoacyl synthase N-terminal-like domain-containing protein [Streptomyces sp. NPDC102360]|uniref:beta-ketoacyl synthase N-terminal-like domain-containing protein n=1 Tax=Streptomyces sp. NPDC102360 TaxID=3366160 RepID=UPI003809D14A